MDYSIATNKNNMFKDKRGIIKDLMVGKDWSITYITFKKGAVRGNHVHKNTIQIDCVIKGLLNCKTERKCNHLVEVSSDMVQKGKVMFMQKGVPHAYKALKDSEIISICFGKRIGKNYSKDTYALQTPLIEPSK